jgi:hypothetical protein
LESGWRLMANSFALEVRMFFFIFITILSIMASVLTHLLASETLMPMWARSRSLRRWRIAILVVAFIIIHMIEIGFFALAISVLLQDGSFGYLEGMDGTDVGSLIYYSAITYTTVGYGDITPIGDMRLFAAIEALTGMVLVAWTASVIFTVMHRVWRAENDKLETQKAGS